MHDEKQENKSKNIESITDTISNDIEKEVLTDDARIQVQENADNLNKGGEVLKDKDGNVFDPSIHASDKDNKPVLTKTGRFRKKSGRKVHSPQKQEVKAGTNPAGSYQAACAATGLFIQTGIGLFGDEWYPQEIPDYGNEEQMLTGAFTRYFEAKEITDFPPNVALVMALSQYALVRATMPKTKSRLSKMKDLFAAKFLNWKVKRNGSFFDNWKNGKRKNDTSNKDGEKPSGEGCSHTGS